MASQAFGFAELVAGGVLLTMGITGGSARDVIAGKAKSPKPFPSTGMPTEGGADVSVAATSPSAKAFVSWAKSQEGIREGSVQQARYAQAAGISPGAAWCAAFVTAGLKRLGITPPPGPGAVADWAGWSGGENIGHNLANARPGDLLRFGDQHIGIYLGGGRMISGNWSNEVATASVSEGPGGLTEIIRVKGLYAAVARHLAGGAASSLGLHGRPRAAAA